MFSFQRFDAITNTTATYSQKVRAKAPAFSAAVMVPHLAS
jgi:hypothetical protein